MKFKRSFNNQAIARTAEDGSRYTLEPNEWELSLVLDGLEQDFEYCEGDPGIVVACDGIPDEVWDNEDELYSRELYSSKIFFTDDIPDSMSCYRTLEDFDNKTNRIDLRYEIDYNNRLIKMIG